MRRLIAAGLAALTVSGAAAPVLADEEPSLQHAILIQPNEGDLPKPQPARQVEPKASVRVHSASRHKARHLGRGPARPTIARTR